MNQEPLPPFGPPPVPARVALEALIGQLRAGNVPDTDSARTLAAQIQNAQQHIAVITEQLNEARNRGDTVRSAELEDELTAANQVLYHGQQGYPHGGDSTPQ